MYMANIGNDGFSWKYYKQCLLVHTDFVPMTTRSPLQNIDNLLYHRFGSVILLKLCAKIYLQRIDNLRLPCTNNNSKIIDKYAF